MSYSICDSSEANSELVKLAVMTNVFFKKQQHQIEFKVFILLNISSLDSSATDEINVFNKKLNFQPNMVAQRLESSGVKGFVKKFTLQRTFAMTSFLHYPPTF